MVSGCGNPIAEKAPSSARQLPIMAALYAGNPTLFPTIIQDVGKKVNGFFPNRGDF